MATTSSTPPNCEHRTYSSLHHACRSGVRQSVPGRDHTSGGNCTTRDALDQVEARESQRMGAVARNDRHAGGAASVASLRMVVACSASARAARSVNEPSQQLLAQLVVDVVDVDGLVWQRNLPSRCIGRRAYPPRKAAHAARPAVLPPTIARSIRNFLDLRQRAVISTAIL